MLGLSRRDRVFTRFSAARLRKTCDSAPLEMLLSPPAPPSLALLTRQTEIILVSPGFDWDWPSGWPRVGQLASPWPIPPRFLLNNRPIPKHRNHLRYSHINIRFTQHEARPGKKGDWLRTRCLYPFFPARTKGDCEAFSSVSLFSSTDSAAV